MENLETISGNYTFYYCTALAEIDLPNLETINGSYTFFKCTDLETLKLNGEIEIDNKTQFSNNTIVYIDRYEEPDGRDEYKDSWGALEVIYNKEETTESTSESTSESATKSTYERTTETTSSTISIGNLNYNNYNDDDILKDETTENEIFKDIVGHWAYEYINTLANQGIINGYTDGTFKPGLTITRADTSIIIHKILTYLGYTFETVENDFIDIDENSYYSTYLLEVSSKGIFVGYNDGTIRPTNNITREEFCTVINRVLELLEVDLENKYEDGRFKPNDDITRAKVCKVIFEILNAMRKDLRE